MSRVKTVVMVGLLPLWCVLAIWPAKSDEQTRGPRS